MLNVVLSPDPLLRQVSLPCTPGDKKIKKLARDMAKIMYKANGVGLAAPQVGQLLRLVVIDCNVDQSDQLPTFLVNPEIIELSGDPIIGGEGCLSCPGINVPVLRQPFARVKYFDLDGVQREISGDGLLGRCLQHEIDHLDGKTLFESCTPEVRLKALQAYHQALERGAQPGDIWVDLTE